MQEEVDGELSIVGNMWHATQFETYLQSLAKSCLPGSDACSHHGNPYRERVEPQLKKGVIASLLATRDTITQAGKHQAHEMFGYDFMVDTNLNVWMLEVNSSPDMSYSSPVTEALVKQVLPTTRDLMMKQHSAVVGNGDWDPLVGDKLGKFELIYADE